MNEEKYKVSLGYWTIGLQYLHLVESVGAKVAEEGNPWFVLTDEKTTPEEYFESTRWADHNLIIPMLFNFYHGLELLLKGFVLLKIELPSKNHKLTELLNDFEANFAPSELLKFFKKYINSESLPPILNEFCSTSGVSMDDYYQALKYPESTKGQSFNHFPLKYNDNRGVPFFQEIVGDIKIARREAVALGRQYENEA